ncbi:HotDog domain-containing protein [Apodospora peruviana]|uniref:HotDog domain-containing protein n=1 Tax=Apodospora peruviana TaxID=516989 RepID=A0AAE0I1A2_9PEZI|nr:HotDog domain-containing protein [Apodospora peruviana]
MSPHRNSYSVVPHETVRTVHCRCQTKLNFPGTYQLMLFYYRVHWFQPGAGTENLSSATTNKERQQHYLRTVAMSGPTQLKSRSRADYPYILGYRTRWNDNDMYDHMNNSVYNFLFDSVINTYLIQHCGLHPPTSRQYGMVVHSHTDYFASISFPACAELALRVNRIGNSSVAYEIALFEKGVDAVRAVGEFVHVFVDRETGRPTPQGMATALREGLQRILVKARQSKI